MVSLVTTTSSNPSLTAKEVEAYAKATLAYELPADVLDAIAKGLQGSNAG